MALPDLDKAVGHSFGFEMDGVQIKQIQAMSGLKIEYADMGSPGMSKDIKGPVRLKAGELVLTRGLTGDDSFEKLIKSIRSGNMGNARKGGAVVVYDYEGKPLKRYNLNNAWPKSLEIGTVKVGDTNVLTEKLVVSYESMDPE